jgi:hypothetical protein
VADSDATTDGAPAASVALAESRDVFTPAAVRLYALSVVVLLPVLSMCVINVIFVIVIANDSGRLST